MSALGVRAAGKRGQGLGRTSALEDYTELCFVVAYSYKARLRPDGPSSEHHR